MILATIDEHIMQFEEKLNWLDSLIKDNQCKMQELQKLNDLYVETVVNYCRDDAPIHDLEKYFLAYYQATDENKEIAKSIIDSIILDNISEIAADIDVIRVCNGKAYELIFDLCDYRFQLFIPIKSYLTKSDYGKGFSYGKYCLSVFEDEYMAKHLIESYDIREIRKCVEKYINGEGKNNADSD